MTSSYESRLRQARELSKLGYFRSAVESASGGIELLMLSLLDEAIERLMQEDIRDALNLKASFDEYKKNTKGADGLTFGRLVNFYKAKDIFDELIAVFDYDFTHFHAENLFDIVTIRNKCVHKDYQPKKTEADFVLTHLGMYLDETNRAPKDVVEPDPLQALAYDWWQKWDAKIQDWLEHHANSAEADLVESLADNLTLVTGLIGSNAVPPEFRHHLCQALMYVIGADDLVPEETAGVPGLVDDAAVLVLTLYWVKNKARIDQIAFRDCWVGEDDVFERIDRSFIYIDENSEFLFDPHTWTRIYPIGTDGPGALWKRLRAPDAPDEEIIQSVYDLITEFPDADNWYDRWRQRIHDWIEKSGNTTLSEIILVLPDLFVLITRLIRDPRVSANVKARLLAATTYVISPFDLIPEGLIGVVGLTDDATALGLIGYWLVNLVKVDPEVLREHWPGEQDPIEVIENLHQQINDNAEAIFGTRTGIMKNLRQRFGQKEKRGSMSLRKRVGKLIGRLRKKEKK